ncbi:UDP-glucosyltransferase 2-like [Condylostylus longicornis]|uniref:UDP-glucosyltransferase 2-like n=1 Tax=Condylostylus longicornis TaxID=2530218 RepID=UPI00244DF617|nr:UDP-glucosyltransferase 2-like [Condylostylus longicornis]
MKLPLLIVLLIHYSSAANILGLMNVASPSHSIWNNVLVKGLAERGHNVTVIITDLPRNPKDILKNVSYFSVEDVYAGVYEEVDLKELFDINPLKMGIEFCSYCASNCKATMNSNGFVKFMKTYDRKFKFDIILYDFTCGPCLLGLLEYFNYPPLVGISAFPFPSFGNSFAGGHDHPGYITYHSALIDPVNSISDRLYNNFLYFFEAIYKWYVFYPNLDQIVREKYFPKDMKLVRDLEKYVTLSLVNSHPSITPAESLPPNVIEIGGLQLTDPEPLPKDIETFISSAKKGAIFFSLGTNVRPQDYSDENIEIFLTIMKKFPEYNFLWKFDADKIKNEIPKNLLIKKFFPQRDILAHPNTKVFISHCGGLSTQESIWYGVPILGLALFGDQIRNIRDAVQKEIALQIDYRSLSVKNLENNLKEILENTKYSNNIKLMSKRFRDRPLKPLDNTIWWIEYVLRNPNPEHLKPKSLKMNFITANSLDFFTLILIVLQVILVIFLAVIWACLCKKTNTSANTQKKKKLN